MEFEPIRKKIVESPSRLAEVKESPIEYYRASEVLSTPTHLRGQEEEKAVNKRLVLLREQLARIHETEEPGESVSSKKIESGVSDVHFKPDRFSGVKHLLSHLVHGKMN